MQLTFVDKENGPERLVCGAEMLFDEEGPLSGLKLVGFSLWRGADGEVYVTLPSRPSGGGTERRFFDFVRSIDGTAAEPRRLKAWILERFRARQDPAAGQAQNASSPAE